MSVKTYTGIMNPSQSEPVLGKDMVKNNAGGYVFELDAWKQLDRFLILGTEGGTYYVGEHKLTMDNSKNILKLIQENGIRVVDTITEISLSGRAHKQDPLLFALALCLKHGDATTRKAAQGNVGKICRIGTHLFHLAEFIKAVNGGWGRGTRNAFASFYEDTAEEVALQMVKYQSRDGWSHVDILRKAHVTPKSDAHNEIFKWALGKEANINLPELKIIQGFELAKKVTDAKELVKLISEYNLPREAIPTNMLNDPKVWESLLMSGKGMPMTAMIRNLGKMSSVGLLKNLSEASRFVVTRLTDEDLLKKARIHPMGILYALKTYAQGHGIRGGNSWQIDQNIVAALEDSFYKAFKFVEPTNKRYMLGIDVSGSMGMGYNDIVSPIECATAMAMVTRKVEPFCYTGIFNTHFVPADISKNSSLQETVKKLMGMAWGGTDCALPMIHATNHKIPVDTFCVYTDNETWFGKVHPFQALKKYREVMGIPAKLVVVGIAATNFTIADPSDAGMLDVVGFDANTPSVISDFSKM